MAKFNLKLKKWETAVILFAIIASALAFLSYITDFPIRKYLFNIEDNGGLILIGEVQKKTGSLKRQISGESEFKGLELKGALYNKDVLVTGPESSTTILLDGEGVIEVGPNSMIRLAFETSLTFDGIDRVDKLDIITGKVKSQAGKRKIIIQSQEGAIEVKPNTNHTVEVKASPVKPVIHTKQDVPPTASPVPEVEQPSPSPIPIPSPTLTQEQADKIKILTPKKGERFSIEENAQAPEKAIKLSWTINPPNAKTLVKIWRVKQFGSPDDSSKEKLLEKAFPTQNGLGAIVWKAKHPGNYEWEITGENGEKISFDANTHSNFSVSSELQGIKTLQPLISGKPTLSNQFQGDHLKEFSIKLRWKPYPNVSKYKVLIYSSMTAKRPLIERTVDQAEFSFNKNQILSGKFFYKIVSTLDTGFTLNSGLQEFSFSFLPSVPALPPKGAVISQKKVKSDGNYLVLTWKKTNFTLGYEVEIAKDAEFKQIHLKKTLKENYFIFKNPPLGQYWWRIRSYAKKLSSPMSGASTFTILP